MHVCVVLTLTPDVRSACVRRATFAKLFLRLRRWTGRLFSALFPFVGPRRDSDCDLLLSRVLGHRCMLEEDGKKRSVLQRAFRSLNA